MYEARDIDTKLSSEEKVDAWFEAKTKGLNDFQKHELKKVWGTCNPKVNRIWLNTELAKKPIESIEYVLIHEMVHLLERNHNEKFIAYMDKFLPKWKHIREELNRSALGHVEWSY